MPCKIAQKIKGRKKMILYPNCSEATMRINISKLPETEIKKLEKLFKDLNESKDEDGYNSFADNTSWDIQKIFGIKVLVCKGDYPFNNGDELNEAVKKAVPMLKEEDIEFEEQ